MTSSPVIDAPDVAGRARRERFVRDVVEAFERAGVEFVLPHEHAGGARDSDVDVAVTRRSLQAVDALVRAGTFGRMLQRLHYDVPWCFYYVVESEEPGRRYRQLDIACDPWGIGRYGPALPIALEFMRRNPRARNLDAATETAYLAIKRARKGIRDESERARLAVVDITPSSDEELASLARAVQRYRGTPKRRLLRAGFQAVRVLRRIRRPTGLVVSLVGPDGTGKSTLADALERDAEGLFRRVDRRHLGPGLLPPPARLLGRRPADGTNPHTRPESGPVSAAARLAYLWGDALVGWLPRMAIPRVRSSLVLLERNWLDLAVDPRRYRLAPRGRVVAALGRLLPRSDLALLLDSPAGLVASRKSELRADEIDRQLHDWRALLPRAGRHAGQLDASAAPERLAEQAREAIGDELECRHPAVPAAALALKLAGPVARDGARVALAEVDRRPRWLIPQRLGGRGPLRSGLYRPAYWHQLAGALGLEALASARRLGTSLPLDIDGGLLPVLRAALERRDLGLGAIGLSRDRPGRALMTLVADGHLAAFAKVSNEAKPLRHEAQVLEALTRARPTTFTVPRPLALLDWEGLTVLALEPIRFRGRALRRIGTREQAVLEELLWLGEALQPVLGSRDELVPVHGDFTPWNTAWLRDGGYVVWDWEDTRLGLPFEDFFHWHAQLLVLFGVGTVEELVASADSPDLVDRAARLGLGREAPARALHGYLEHRMLTPEPHDIAERALGLIERRHR